MSPSLGHKRDENIGVIDSTPMFTHNRTDNYVNNRKIEFVDDIINDIEAITEPSRWCVSIPARRYTVVQRPPAYCFDSSKKQNSIVVTYVEVASCFGKYRK